MKRLSLLLFVACNAGSEPAQKVPAPQPAPAPKPLAPITGSHGGAITALAVTADGTAAASADHTGGLRLWPTLDGTREPIVVKGPVAAALAIGHDGSGYAIAVTDAADQVELIRLDNKGNIRTRTRLGEAIQLEIVGDAVLALRVDQNLDVIAIDGTLRGRLSADPGTQVKSLVVRDPQVLAIVTGEQHVTTRKIDLEKVAWGESSVPLAMSPDAVAVLSADSKTLVAMGAKHDHIMKFDLATGKAKPTCPEGFTAQRLRRFGGEFGGFGGGQIADMPLGFVDGKLACFVDNVLTWWNIDKNEQTGQDPTPGSTVFVAANERVISGVSHQLAIHTPDHIDWLGYGFRDLTHVRSVPNGLMIGKGDQEPVLLDNEFRERAKFSLPKLRVDWTDLVPIDDRYIIASSTRPGGTDLWGSAYQIAIYDTVKEAMHQVLALRARTGELAYEPSTQMLLASDGNKSLLVRFDPETHTFGNEIALELATVPKEIELLDPKLANGAIALAIHDSGGGGIEVEEFYAADIPSTQEDGKYVMRSFKPRKTYRVAGELRAVDRAGKLYIHNVMHADEVAIYAGGVSKVMFKGAQDARLRPSPDGKHVVAVDNGKLAMWSTDGTRLWETAAWGSSDIDWTPAGVLYARFPHALARIDVATGSLQERQCGWAFGISATSRDSSSDAPSVCDVAP